MFLVVCNSLTLGPQTHTHHLLLNQFAFLCYTIVNLIKVTKLNCSVHVLYDSFCIFIFLHITFLNLEHATGSILQIRGLYQGG